MHERYVYILRIIRVPFTDVKVGKQLLPYALFHRKERFTKVTEKKSSKAIIFAILKWGISSFG